MEGGEQITAISATQGGCGQAGRPQPPACTACSWSFASDRLCGLEGAASKKRGLSRPPGPPPGWPGVCGPRGGVSKSPRSRPLRGAAGKSGGPSLRPAQPVAGPSPPAASTSRPAPLRKGAGLTAPGATAWVVLGAYGPEVTRPQVTRPQAAASHLAVVCVPAVALAFPDARAGGLVHAAFATQKSGRLWGHPPVDDASLRSFTRRVPLARLARCRLGRASVGSLAKALRSPALRGAPCCGLGKRLPSSLPLHRCSTRPDAAGSSRS